MSVRLARKSKAAAAATPSTTASTSDDPLVPPARLGPVTLIAPAAAFAGDRIGTLQCRLLGNGRNNGVGVAVASALEQAGGDLRKAQRWLESNAQLWASVVSPFILVQQEKPVATKLH